MSVKLRQQENKSGNPSLANQGFGQVNFEDPPQHFEISEARAATDFFEEHGFVVLKNCLDKTKQAEMRKLLEDHLERVK